MRVFFIWLAIILSGCSALELKHDPNTVFANPDAYSFSERFASAYQNRDADKFIAMLHPEVEENLEHIQTVREWFTEDRSPIIQIDLFYAENRVGEGEYNSVPIYMTVYDVILEDGFEQLTLAVAEHDGECCVGTYWRSIQSDVRPSTYNAFSLSGKGPTHYVVMTLMIIVPLLIIITAIHCVLQMKSKIKWIWFIFILFGLWGITFNWSTGALTPSFFEMSSNGIRVEFIEFRLLGVSAFTSGVFRPWIIEVGLPLGALLYWASRIKRRRDRADQTAPKPYETRSLED